LQLIGKISFEFDFSSTLLL